MKKFLSAGVLLLMLTLLTSTTVTYAQENGEVKWMTFEEAVEKSKTEKRKIFIDVYTDWCGWCKVMDKKTFSEPAVAKLLNEKYIVYNGTTFKFIDQGGRGTHQLAAALLNNQLSYPSVVFLNEDFAIIHILKGYRQAPEFHKIGEFIGGDFYKTIKMDAWEPQYQSPF
jgi:thioredoxin-related protein